jgi:hypothetical protein
MKKNWEGRQNNKGAAAPSSAAHGSGTQPNPEDYLKEA